MEAVVLGLIQGFTEFLPVSSSGHLAVAHRLFGLEQGSLTFDIWLHVGTLAAVLVAYRKDLVDLCRQPRSPMFKWLVAGTIPTAIIGILLRDAVERLVEGGRTLPLEFAVTGIVLYLAESVRPGGKRIENLHLADALWIGVCQGLAVLPALSRSGLTVAGALWRGMERREAARFSFLLSVPAIAGAALLEGMRAGAGGDIWGWPELVGAMAAAFSGYAAISWMIRILSKKTLKPFAWYVWGLAAVVFLLQVADWI